MPPTSAPAAFTLTTMLRDDDEYEPEYSCSICGRTFSSYSRLQEHTDEEHTEICRRCQKNPAGEEGLCYICRTYSH